MDAIYASTRVVVVALEDIEVTLTEQTFFEEFIKDYEDEKHPLLPPPHVHETSPPYMMRLPVLRDFFFKFCRARWFTRAWCMYYLFPLLSVRVEPQSYVDPIKFSRSVIFNRFVSMSDLVL